MSASNSVRVLCIEDEPITAKLLQKRLSRAGYEVDLAYDGEEGLAKWLSGSYEVLTTDHDMPKKQGLELIRDLASRGLLPPIIMITGHGNELIAVEAMKLGADDYVLKDPEGRFYDLLPHRIEEARNKRRLRDEKIKAEAELRVHQVRLEKQNEELREAQIRLEVLKDKYQDLYDFAPVGYVTLDEQGLILEANLTAVRLLGEERQQLIEGRFDLFVCQEFRADFGLHIRQVFASQSKQTCEIELATKDGARFHAQLESIAVDGDVALVQGQVPSGHQSGPFRTCRTIVSNISNRKRAQRRQLLSAEIPGILNDPLSWDDAITRILNAIKLESGFDAVGIRLKSGDDFPYFVQEGFSTDFLKTENSLIVRDNHGSVCRNMAGEVSLACTCGLVLSGRTDPQNPLFTPYGSFWTNESYELLEIPPDQDPRLCPRNFCVYEGFGSIALIPLRAGQGIVGLLQLNGWKKDSLTLDRVRFFEGIGASIGVALMQRQAREKVRHSDGLFRSFFEANINYCYVVSSDNVILNVNDSALKALGYDRDELVGQSIAKIYAPESQARAADVLGKSKQEGRVENEELVILTTSGRTRTVLLNRSYFHRPDGGMPYSVYVQTDITERKRVEEENHALLTAVLAEKQRLSALVNSIADEVWFIDTDRRFTLVNEAALREFCLGDGNQVELARLAMSLEVLRGDGSPRPLEEAPPLRALQGEVVRNLDEIVRTPVRGELRHRQVSSAPVRDSQGCIVGAVSVVRDITDLKKAEDAVREIERRYLRLFEHAPVGIFYSTFGGKFVTVNAALAEMSGYDSPEEMISCVNQTSIAEAFYMDQLTRPKLVAAAREMGAKWLRSENVFRRKDGTPFTGEMTFRAVEGATGGSAIMEGFIVDITRRRQAEEALQASEASFRSLVAHLPQRIFLKDRNSVYLSCNANYAADLGIEPEQIAGKDDFAFYPTELADKYRADDQLCMASEMVRDIEEPYQLAGKKRWAHTVKVPYSDAQGRIVGVLGIFEDITERKQAGDALRASEERFRTIFEQGPLGMGTLDLDFRWLSVNAELCEMLGYSEEELTKLTFSDITHPDDIEASLDQTKKLLQGEIPLNKIEKRYLKKNGQVLWIDVTAAVIRDERGEALYFLAMIKDITERKQAEEELRTTLHRFYTILSNMYSGLLLVTSEGRIEFANQAFCDMFDLKAPTAALHGLSAGETIQLIQQVYAEPDKAVTRIHEIVETQRLVRGEEISIRDGRTYLRDFIPIHVAGKSYGRLWRHEDITDRKQAEDKIREQKEFLDTVIESLTHPFAIINANDYTIEKANSAAVSAGITTNTTCYAATHRRTSPCEGEDHCCPLEEVKKTGQPARVEHIHYDAIGQARHVEVHCFPLLDSSGTVQRVIEYSLDITDRKKAQEALVQSEKFRAVVDLTAGVAHNFNNLLQVVMGNASLGLMYLQFGDFTSLKGNLDQIIESSKFGAETVKRLGRYALRDVPGRPVETEVYDLSELVRQATEMSSPWWKTEPEKHGITISLDTRLKSGCTVRGNKGHMFEVVVNLVKNAVEALPSGGDIEIDTAVEGDSVALRVRDTGIGISKENFNRLFTPFFTTHADAGRGLGLATCRRIVEAHGGGIDVVSKEGKGSSFTVTLPFAAEGPQGELVPRGGPEQALTILAVDDMEATARMLKSGLERFGHTVLTAASGEEALKIYRGNVIDLVICDLGMPGINGLMVARTVKSICDERKARKTPFIILTGWDDPTDDRQNTVELGVDATVRKPVEIAQLLEVIRQVVERQSPG